MAYFLFEMSFFILKLLHRVGCCSSHLAASYYLVRPLSGSMPSGDIRKSLGLLGSLYPARFFTMRRSLFFYGVCGM